MWLLEGLEDTPFKILLFPGRSPYRSYYWYGIYKNCGCEVQWPKNWSARMCACEPRSRCARCVRATQKTVATHTLVGSCCSRGLHRTNDDSELMYDLRSWLLYKLLFWPECTGRCKKLRQIGLPHLWEPALPSRSCFGVNPPKAKLPANNWQPMTVSFHFGNFAVFRHFSCVISFRMFSVCKAKPARQKFKKSRPTKETKKNEVTKMKWTKHKALCEVNLYQKYTELLICKMPFHFLIRDIYKGVWSQWSVLWRNFCSCLFWKLKKVGWESQAQMVRLKIWHHRKKIKIGNLCTGAREKKRLLRNGQF